MREGITPEGLEALVANIETLEYATIVGIGTNLACHVGLMPDEQNMAILSTLAHWHTRLKLSSGENSTMCRQATPVLFR